MDLPEHCFCGCGESRSKLDAANMEGFTVALELGRWLNLMSVIEAIESDADWSDTRAFIEDGHTAYRMALDEVHGGVKIPRKARKARSKWVKYSGKARQRISEVVPADEPDPFDLPLPHPQQIRAWVLDGVLLPIEADQEA
jgi:hypothetical protein